jgi:hypothetical protein
MKCILFDMNTRCVFSELMGWNKSEASLRTHEEWTRLIYHYEGAICDAPAYRGWEGRKLYLVPVSLVYEAEQFT